MDQFRLKLSIPELKKAFEKEALILSRYAIAKCKGNKTEAAKLLGVKRTCLIEFLKKVGYPIKRKKRAPSIINIQS